MNRKFHSRVLILFILISLNIDLSSMNSEDKVRSIIDLNEINYENGSPDIGLIPKSDSLSHGFSIDPDLEIEPWMINTDFLINKVRNINNKDPEKIFKPYKMDEGVQFENIGGRFHVQEFDKIFSFNIN